MNVKCARKMRAAVRGISVVVLLGSYATALPAASVRSATTHASRAQSCFQLHRQRQDRDGSFNYVMPDVCPAMLKSLNSVCARTRDLFDVVLGDASLGVTNLTWEQIPINPDSMRLLEQQVRAKWRAFNMILIPLRPDQGVWHSRADQEWELTRRAIEQAQKLGQPIIFDRTQATFRGRQKPLVIYRLRIINKPQPSNEEIEHLGPDGLEQSVRLFGIAPVLFADAEIGITLSAQLVVNYDGVTYTGSVDTDGSVDLREVLTGSPSMLASRDICRLQATHAVSSHEKGR